MNALLPDMYFWSCANSVHTGPPQLGIGAGRGEGMQAPCSTPTRAWSGPGTASQQWSAPRLARALDALQPLGVPLSPANGSHPAPPSPVLDAQSGRRKSSGWAVQHETLSEPLRALSLSLK